MDKDYSRQIDRLKEEDRKIYIDLGKTENPAVQELIWSWTTRGKVVGEVGGLWEGEGGR